MKTKDFQTGVVYVHKRSGRFHYPLKKGVIVSLDKRYAQPSRNMIHGYKTIVEESKGSGACYFVIEGDHYVKNAELIQIATEFTLPATGKAWPYQLTRGSVKRKREPWGSSVEKADYDEVEDYDGLPHGMSVALWLPQAFDHEFLSAEDSQARHDLQRSKHAESVQKSKLSKKQRVESILSCINQIGLEGVSEADVLNKDGKRRATIPVSLDVLEALLKRAV